MTLTEVLALRPEEGSNAATIAAANDAAEEMRRTLLEDAKTADRLRAGGLLTLDEKAIAKLDRDSSQARLAADRIAALLPDIKADLAKARGNETLVALRVQHVKVMELVALAEAWGETELPKMRELLRAGVVCEQTAKAAVDGFASAVKAAYRRTEVENAGPLGLPIPKMPKNTVSEYLLAASLTGRIDVGHNYSARDRRS